MNSVLKNEKLSFPNQWEASNIKSSTTDERCTLRQAQYVKHLEKILFETMKSFSVNIRVQIEDMAFKPLCWPAGHPVCSLSGETLQMFRGICKFSKLEAV